MITPYDAGFSLGSAVTGAVVGVTQSVGRALDFSHLISGEGSAAAEETSAETPSFEGLNDHHRVLAAHRTELVDALAQLNELLEQWNLGDDVTLSMAQDGSGGWNVSGPAGVRAQVESLLEQSPQWQEAWEQVQHELQQLQELTASATELPESVRVEGNALSQARALESYDLRLERSQGNLELVVL